MDKKTQLTGSQKNKNSQNKTKFNIKSTMHYHLIHVRMTITQKTEQQIANKGMDKRELVFVLQDLKSSVTEKERETQRERQGWCTPQ